MSYTTFEFSDLRISAPKLSATSLLSVQVSVSVQNTGEVSGSEVVQCYITLPATSRLAHPRYQLRAFAKAGDVAPGEVRAVTFTLDKYAVSYWDEIDECWVGERGAYTVSVGRASDDLLLVGTLVLDNSFTWTGL